MLFGLVLKHKLVFTSFHSIHCSIIVMTSLFPSFGTWFASFTDWNAKKQSTSCIPKPKIMKWYCARKQLESFEAQAGGGNWENTWGTTWPLCKRWQIRNRMAELGGFKGVRSRYYVHPLLREASFILGRDSSFFLVVVHKILVPTEMGGCFITKSWTTWGGSALQTPTISLSLVVMVLESGSLCYWFPFIQGPRFPLPRSLVCDPNWFARCWPSPSLRYIRDDHKGNKKYIFWHHSCTHLTIEM